MSFRVVNLDNGEQTGKLRGNVVLGRKGRPEEYDDRTTVGGVDVDQYERMPGELYNREISANHVFVAENPDWYEETRLNSGTEEVPTGRMGLDVWDLNSLNGTQVEGFDTQTGHPTYEVGGSSFEIRPLNHYIGIAGPDSRDVGMENNIESLADNLENRGFETDTITDASWGEVNSSLERVEELSEEESSTLIMYTGHGASTGEMALKDEAVKPEAFINRADDIDGEKLLVIDQCHAGYFADEEIPEDMTVYMASGAGDTTQANSFIADERRTRYAGRVVAALESERGDVSMDDVHSRVASVSKVADNNPSKKGSGGDISSIK